MRTVEQGDRPPRGAVSDVRVEGGCVPGWAEPQTPSLILGDSCLFLLSEWALRFYFGSLDVSGVLWSQARCGIREPGHFYWKWPIDNGLCENSERMDTDPLSTQAAERWDVGAGLGTVGGAWILALLKPQAVTAALLNRQHAI